MADTLETLEIQVQHSATSAATEIKAVANAVKSLGNALEKALPTLSAFQKVLGKNKFNFTSNQIDNSQYASQITNVKQAAQKAQASTKEVSKGIKDVSHAAAKSKGPLETFISSLKRIAMYRIMRSIIKAITTAFSEGLEWAYAFSKGIEGEGRRFAAAMDSMKSAGNTMKLQLGSAFISLLALIAPIINAIIGLVTSLANALSQLFAVFTGGTYLKANDAAADLADQMKAGGGAAKEWKNQLLGFDVINRLNEPSGGGGGGGVGDASNLFEDTEITGWFAMLKAKWDELINSIDFGPLLDAWARLKAAVSEFVGIVNHALLWAWNNILVPLAHWTIEKAAPAVVKLLASAFEFLNAALKKLGPVFQKLWDSVLKPFFAWLGNALVKAVEWIADAFSGLAEKIANAKTLREFLESLNGKEIIVLAVAASIVILGTAFLIFNTVNAILSVFSAIVAGIASPVGAAILAITALIALGIALYSNWDSIVAGIKDVLNGVKETFSQVFTSISETVSQFTQKVKSTISQINTFLEGIFIGSWKKAWSNIVNFLKNVLTTINNIVMAVVRAIMNIASAISSLRLSMGSLTTTSIVFGGSGYATGGFPEDGLFFANHSELVGQFSNGKTAVANNQQIIEGIKQGVYEAMTMAGSGNSRQSEVVFNVNGKEFARAIYNDQKAVAREHGVSMVSY